jgi:hypothetical protein
MRRAIGDEDGRRGAVDRDTKRRSGAGTGREVEPREGRESEAKAEAEAKAKREAKREEGGGRWGVGEEFGR